MNQASGKRGPRLAISEDGVEWQRLSKQKRNARSGLHGIYSENHNFQLRYLLSLLLCLVLYFFVETVPRENTQSKAITGIVCRLVDISVQLNISKIPDSLGVGIFQPAF